MPAPTAVPAGKWSPGPGAEHPGTARWERLGGFLLLLPPFRVVTAAIPNPSDLLTQNQDPKALSGRQIHRSPTEFRPGLSGQARTAQAQLALVPEGVQTR